jgi:uncharacterized membrane protein
VAGIGFELKRLFKRKGVFATLKAYGYAGIVTTGPMILGILLLFGIMILGMFFNTPQHDRELLSAMLVYALVASLTVTSFFSLITTRYAADMMYCGTCEAITPSFYGSLGIMLTVGGLAYGIFLSFAGISFLYQMLSLLFFLVLITVWTEINYLTAIKDYQGILKAFVDSLVISFLLAFSLLFLTTINNIVILFFSVLFGYSLLATRYFSLLYTYFPEGFGSSMNFLRWVRRYPSLAFVGSFLTMGLFGHLIIMWSGVPGVQIQGLFYGAPQYDISALAALLSILITSINFIVSVEVRFYPLYRDYFSLFNFGGTIDDIETSERSMIRVLRDELSYLALKQALATVLFLVVGTMMLPRLNLGFTAEMLGIFRVLCVGYALFAIGNSLMLILLYFSDNLGALLCTGLFFVTSNAVTWLLKDGNSAFYGFGFVLGGLVFCAASYIRLNLYLRKLKYHVLGKQPIFLKSTEGAVTRFCDRMEQRAVKKQRARKEFYEELMQKLEIPKNLDNEYSKRLIKNTTSNGKKG